VLQLPGLHCLKLHWLLLLALLLLLLLLLLMAAQK
jgi:hypothetical protein